MKHKKETILKLRKSAIKMWQNPHHRKMVTDSNKKTWGRKEITEKHRASLIRSWDSERRKRNSKTMKKLWKTKSFREKLSGKNNSFWRGGASLRFKNDKGYVVVHKPTHPNSDSRGRIREHRIVVESMIKRLLKKGEVVHHLGKVDDNRPEVLMAFSCDKFHKRFHAGIEVPEKEIIFDGRKLAQRK